MPAAAVAVGLAAPAVHVVVHVAVPVWVDARTLACVAAVLVGAPARGADPTADGYAQGGDASSASPSST